MLQSRAEPYTRAEHDEQTKCNSHKAEVGASSRCLFNFGRCWPMCEGKNDRTCLNESGLNSLQGLVAPKEVGVYSMISTKMNE